MTSPSRRRWIAPSLALALAVGAVGALSSPASAVQTTFTNGGGIAIADPVYEENTSSITINDANQASPYPSTVSFADSGVIADVDVYLNSVDHGYPDDVDVLLVGPGGQQATIMSDAGGTNDLIDADLYFDDEAPAQLPDTDAFDDSVSWQPTNHEGADDFPTVASVSGNSALSVFDGTNVQGDWKLYVVDDDGGIAGDISGGWALNVWLRSAPSPSQINVGGLGTRVSDVNLTLTGLTHTWPNDIDILLVGPGGQQATVMSDAGSSVDIVGVNLALDDEALASLPDAAQIATGSYKPTNFETETDYFPAPAPAASGSSALSAFDGTDPNGTWSLYVADDVSSDMGTLAGWSLEIETDNTPPSGTVVINGGAATVGSSSVTLSLAASDPGTPTSGVVAMRFSNDGVTFSAYQPFAATAAWSLSAGDGVKTVYAQFKDGSGNQSAVTNDTVTVALPDTTAPTVTKTTPKKNAKGVKVTTKVKVKVSEALKGKTVSKKTVFLKAKGSSDKVKAKVTYNSSKKMIVLTPDKALKKNKKYNVTVTTKVKDLAGNAFDAKPGKSGAQALKFSFTTA